MIKQYIFVLKNDTFFSQSVGRKQLFWFFEALDCVNVKTKCAVCAVGFKLAENGLGIAEGGDFFAQNFNRNTAVQILQKS